MHMVYASVWCVCPFHDLCFVRKSDCVNVLKGTVQYVILKALPPVCMKYTARGESRVANIA